MKAKQFLTMAILVLVSACMLAQDSTQVVITHVKDQPILDFLNANVWQFAFLIFMCLETWLGSTGKVKDGSVVALILNWIGKMLGSKANVIRDKVYYRDKQAKANQRGQDAAKSKQFPNLPKILILGLALSTTSLVAQSPWNGFFKPVEKDMFLYSTAEDLKAHEWMFRPQVTITAMKFSPSDVEGRTYDVTSLTSAGVGVGYQHYVESNGEPYNNYGANLLFLFDAIPTETAPTGISVAGTFNFLKYISVGVGWDFTQKNYFLLSGVVLTF